MAPRWVSAAFVRGGTSEGLFFEARALPEAIEERNSFLLAALGSPDEYGRQLDGMVRRTVLAVEGRHRRAFCPARVLR